MDDTRPGASSISLEERLRQDESVLADLMRRAIQGRMLEVKAKLVPEWQVDLVTGGYSSAGITLTDAEIETLRRAL